MNSPSHHRRIRRSSARHPAYWGPPLALALIFWLTALVGVWAAYDRTVAWDRFTLITIGLLMAALLANAGLWWGDRALALAGMGLALLAGALAIYFLFTYDWRQQATIKFPLLYQWGVWWQDHRPSIPVPEDINANVAASGLELLLPLGIGAALFAIQQRWLRPVAFIALAAALLAAITLVVTMSRGSWLGLGAGGLLALYIWWRTRSNGRWRRRDDLIVGLLMAGILVVFLMALLAPGWLHLLDSLGFAAATGSRVALWRDALTMIGDYPFTGSGLGVTMMVHASYVMLIHVGFIAQMHNLFLEVAVQQGLPGMAALIGLLVAAAMALRSRLIHRGPSILLFAVIISLTALIVHGMFDAAVYASHMAPLMFLPMGFALGLAPKTRRTTQSSHLQRRMFLLGGLLALGLLWLLTPAARSAFLSNLGAVQQTRAELSVYDWPEWGIQDAVRRSPNVDLSPAIAYYQAALVLNQDNVSANRRLGQIQLSRGSYQQAHSLLQRAYAHAPWQHPNRLLLGESYAIRGEIEPAARLWSTISAQLWWDKDWIGPQSFRTRQWWHHSIEEEQQANWIGEVIDQATTIEQETNP